MKRTCGANTAWATTSSFCNAATTARSRVVALRISAHKFEYRTRFADYAILYRGNHQARLFEEACAKPRSVCALGRAIVLRQGRDQGPLCLYAPGCQPDDDRLHPCRHHPRRGVGAATLEKLGDHADSATSACSRPLRSRLSGPAPARQLEPLLAFCDFIKRIGERAERKQPAIAGRTPCRHPL